MGIITGGCFCGQVRYQVDDMAAKATVCHCAGCRRAEAEPAVAWITVPTADFRLLQGELRSVRGRAGEPETCDCGGGTRGFCANCGTHITYSGDDRAQEIDITTGSLDEPDRFPPAEDIFPHRKVAWMPRLVG